MCARFALLAALVAVMACEVPNPAFRAPGRNQLDEGDFGDGGASNGGGAGGAGAGGGAAGGATGTGGAGLAGASGLGGSNSGGGGTPGAGGTGAGGASGAGGIAGVEPAPLTNVPPPAPPSAGLLARYAFDEAGGATSEDASGNKMHAMVAGAGVSFVSGRFGRAVEIGGAGELVVADCDCLDRIMRAFTIAVWIKVPSVSAGFQTIVSRQIGTTNQEHYWLGLNSGRPQGGMPAYIGFASATAVTPQRWTHLAVTFEGSTATLYVDGAIASARTDVQPPVADTTPLLIGANQNYGNREERFIGAIDELLLYDRALAAAEVRTLAGR